MQNVMQRIKLKEKTLESIESQLTFAEADWSVVGISAGSCEKDSSG